MCLQNEEALSEETPPSASAQPSQVYLPLRICVYLSRTHSEHSGTLGLVAQLQGTYVFLNSTLGLRVSSVETSLNKQMSWKHNAFSALQAKLFARGESKLFSPFVIRVGGLEMQEECYRDRTCLYSRSRTLTLPRRSLVAVTPWLV